MILAENKKALFDYEILERYEAGLVLSGQETKSAKQGQVNLKGAFVTFYGSRPMVTNMHISKYKPAGSLPDYDPTRPRHLLLRKKESAYLQGKSMEKGLTIVPIRVYTKGRLIKMEVALARGKREFDKRESIRKKDLKREMARAMKQS